MYVSDTHTSPSLAAFSSSITRAMYNRCGDFVSSYQYCTILNQASIDNVSLCTYSQPHLIGTWLIGSSGSDQDFTPDNHCYDRQVASLSVITMAYQVRNHDHFLNSRLTRFRLSGVDCTSPSDMISFKHCLSQEI